MLQALNERRAFIVAELFEQRPHSLPAFERALAVALRNTRKGPKPHWPGRGRSRCGRWGC